METAAMEIKNEMKVEEKSEIKNEMKVEEKSEIKNEMKVEEKSEIKNEMKVEDKSEIKDKSLYICVDELDENDENCYVIYAIKLGDILSSSEAKAESKAEAKYSDLRKVASADKGLPQFMGCGVFGSKILFVGGVDRNIYPDGSSKIWAFETDPTEDPEPNIKYQSSFGELAVEKPRAILFEVNGNLYVLSGWPIDIPGNYDEELTMLMPFHLFLSTNERWYPLPLLNLMSEYKYEDNDALNRSLSYAVVGTRIMVSIKKGRVVDPLNCPAHSDLCYGVEGDVDTLALTLEDPLWVIDVAKRSYKWIRKPYNNVFPVRGRALVLDDDDEHIMFSYGKTHRGWAIVASRLLGDFPLFGQLLQPPCLPTEFEGVVQYSFAHLGGRKVCLVVGHFIPRYNDDLSFGIWDKGLEKTSLQLIVFEFSVSEGGPVSLQVQSSRTFEYNWPSGEGISDQSGLRFSNLLGCFVLDTCNNAKKSNTDQPESIQAKEKRCDSMVRELDKSSEQNL